MDLYHSLTVPVDIDTAWETMQDIGLVAPCMPGVTITSIDGNDFTGTAKIKLGPIGLLYKGAASFVELDEEARQAVIEAKGTDSRGNGTAAARVTATLVEDGTGTKVEVLTKLDITGKPAQFGRGVMTDVADRLFGQFAERLAVVLSQPAPSPGDTVPLDASATGQQGAPSAPAAPAAGESLGLLWPIALAVLKRLVPLASLGVLARSIMGRRRSARRPDHQS
jgi:carbon monoxide dehydrogenase subunit G